MRSLQLAVPVAALLVLTLAVSACQEPTGVGLGLIDDDTSQPRIDTVFASSSAIESATTTTAGFAETGTPIQTRVLVGSVEDPLYGDAVARAYVDAGLPAAGRPENFQDSTITAVALELRFDETVQVSRDTVLYVYGDPNAPLPIEVREVTTSWAPTDLDVDEILETGDVIATGTIAPTDTTFTIDLDAAWVAANADNIRSSEFLTTFEGFEIRVPDAIVSGSVRGFDTSRIDMLVATAGDTLRFPISEVLTSIEQTPPPTPGDGLTLRAGRPEALAFDFDLASIGATALARADLRLPVSRENTGGTTFIRPLTTQALLVGIDADGNRVQLDVLSLQAEGDAVTVGGQDFTGAIQDVLIGSRTFVRYEVTLPSNPVSLDLLPVGGAPAENQDRARFLLTLIGQSDQPS